MKEQVMMREVGVSAAPAAAAEGVAGVGHGQHAAAAAQMLTGGRAGDGWSGPEVVGLVGQLLGQERRL